LGQYRGSLRNTWLAVDLQQTSTCTKLSPPSYRYMIRIPYMPGHNTWCHGDTNAEMSMVIMWTSDVYHLLHMCHAHIKIRTNLSVLECSVALFSYYFCISLSQVTHTHTHGSVFEAQKIVQTLRSSAYAYGIC